MWGGVGVGGETDLKTELCMPNTMGDVTLTNISRGTSYFHDFPISKIKVLHLFKNT